MTTPLLAAGPRAIGGTDDTTAAAVLFNPTGPRTTGSGSETAPHQLSSHPGVLSSGAADVELDHVAATVRTGSGIGPVGLPDQPEEVVLHQ